MVGLFSLFVGTNKWKESKFLRLKIIFVTKNWAKYALILLNQLIKSDN